VATSNLAATLVSPHLRAYRQYANTPPPPTVPGRRRPAWRHRALHRSVAVGREAAGACAHQASGRMASSLRSVPRSVLIVPRSVPRSVLIVPRSVRSVPRSVRSVRGAGGGADALRDTSVTYPSAPTGQAQGPTYGWTYPGAGSRSTPRRSTMHRHWSIEQSSSSWSGLTRRATSPSKHFLRDSASAPKQLSAGRATSPSKHFLRDSASAPKLLSAAPIWTMIGVVVLCFGSGCEPDPIASDRRESLRGTGLSSTSTLGETRTSWVGPVLCIYVCMYVNIFHIWWLAAPARARTRAHIAHTGPRRQRQSSGVSQTPHHILIPTRAQARGATPELRRRHHTTSYFLLSTDAACPERSSTRIQARGLTPELRRVADTTPHPTCY